MRYFNTVSIEELAYNNIKDFIKNKKNDSDLFDLINAGTLNDFLRGLMEGLSAKVFRTYLFLIIVSMQVLLCKKNCLNWI
jgi:DNA topoisomerase-1